MDGFAPGWRDHVTMRARDQMRGTAFWYWVSLFEKHEFRIAKEAPLIRGDNNQPPLLAGASLAAFSGG